MAQVATMPAKQAREGEAAIVPSGAAPAAATESMATIEKHPDWALLGRIPMCVAASIPLRGFTVRDLVELRAGAVVRSEWLSGEDVPLKIGAVEIGWSEFEVVEQRLAIRLTRLA
jgi:flagellar motor switch/type III secretory pathway protein FliN